MMFVALKETAPHLLPAPLRPAERFVAVLQEGNGSPGFVMTVDLRSKSFSVRPVGSGAAPAGRSYQMWFVHPTFAGGPRSLGVFTDRVPDIAATLGAISGRHRQQRDLCGLDRAARRLADRLAHRAGAVPRQADRTGSLNS